MLISLYQSYTNEPQEKRGAVRLHASPQSNDYVHPADVSDMEAQHLRDADEFELTGLIDDDSDSAQPRKERVSSSD